MTVTNHDPSVPHRASLTEHRFVVQARTVFGKISRVAFFALTAMAWWIAADASDLGAFETPFASLTLSMLLVGVSRVGLLIGTAYWWCRWAFNGEDKEYELWATLGWLGLVMGILGWLWMNARP